jgi:glutathione synthase/RimK-type ligase-like ATP-grasp enzyme
MDIMPVLHPTEVKSRIEAGADFFTWYIPSDKEYRVWIYRRRHLATYEKVLTHPAQYSGIGRNYGNGWAFQLVPSQDVPRAAVDVASRAVEALGLDFGAVDVLRDLFGVFVALEVNSSPGVEGESRRGIRRLADKIVRWHNLGFPKRRGA